MKVRITTELTDPDRLMIGAGIHGRMGTPATHEECSEFLESVIAKGLAPLRRQWDVETKNIIEHIKDQLG